MVKRGIAVIPGLTSSLASLAFEESLRCSLRGRCSRSLPKICLVLSARLELCGSDMLNSEQCVSARAKSQQRRGFEESDVEP